MAYLITLLLRLLLRVLQLEEAEWKRRAVVVGEPSSPFSAGAAAAAVTVTVTVALPSLPLFALRTLLLPKILKLLLLQEEVLLLPPPPFLFFLRAYILVFLPRILWEAI